VTRKTVRVLVVDDSAYNRRTIADMLDSLDGVTVVGKATDGDEALRLCAELSPDCVTLDLEMPRMDGFTFLRLLMARQPIPVIVVSGYSAKENVFRALELGAIDFVSKPSRAVTTDLGEIRDELAATIELIRNLSPAGLDRKGGGRTATDRFLVPGFLAEHKKPVAIPEPKRIVVIGASTGGPTALLDVFASLPGSSASSVVVAQHMPERFTKTFAERLDRLGGLRVREAGTEELLEAGTAWVCPGGFAAEVHRTAEGFVLRTSKPGPEDRFVPSVDRLFDTAAAAAGARVVAVVLTGMGDDGAKGVVAVKKAGGLVLAEAAETAVIYGMPGAAVRTGSVDRSLPLRSLSMELLGLIG
jgi:two-component system chemotaxis response regulator CheB